jgi:hypothetical protein
LAFCPARGRASLPDMASSTANRTGHADKILPPEAQPVCWEFRHECFLLDFAHCGVCDAKLGIQKIGIECAFPSEAPA